MGIFRQFPYTNFHEMNLDEIIKIVKNMLEEWAKYYTEWDDWKNQVTHEWEEMVIFINNYFDNLDVQEEINNKIISMVNSGEFGNIVDPYIPPEVSSWLADHITQPVGVVIDTSLSVSGACADAKAAGDGITALKDELTSDDVERLITSNQLVWTNNTVIADGGGATIGATPHRATCLDYIPVKKGYKIIVNAGYGVRYAQYTSKSPSSKFALHGFGAVTTYVIDQDCYIRISIKNSSDTDLTQSDFDSAFSILCGYLPAALEQANILKDASLTEALYYNGSGITNVSSRMAISSLIPVNPDTFYVFKCVYDDTNDGNGSTNRIVGFDENKEFVEVVFMFGMGGDSAISNIERWFTIENTNIKYISLSFCYLNCTSYELYADAGFLNSLGVSNEKNEKNINLINSEKFALKENSPACIKQMLTIANSYVGQKDSSDNYVLHYGNRTPLQNNYDDDNSIDCSTYIGFVLRGISYDDSPYGLTNDTPNYDDDNGESTDNESGNDSNYNYKQWTANSKYVWSIDPSNYDLPLEYDLTADVPVTTDPMYFVVRRASQLAQMFAEQGREVALDDHLNNLEVGDLVFWSRRKSNGNWLQPYRYRHIGHVALIIKKEPAPVNASWDTAKHPWQHTYIEVINAPAGQDVLHTNILELEGDETTNNVSTFSCAMRPDLGATMAVNKYTDRHNYTGEICYDSNYLYICLDGTNWKKVAIS